MGVWDNIKSRFGRGERDDHDDYDDYDDGYYDDYDDYHGNGQYYDDDVRDTSTANTPLVSMADIRSQQISYSRGAGSRDDRIPAPVVRERRQLGTPGLTDDDSEAFRDGLARSNQNSLVQLHSERIQLEANAVPEFSVPETSRRPLVGQSIASATGYTPRGSAGVVTPRGARQVEHLAPQSYADAERISISLRHGSAVVLDLTAVRPELAKRILDFSFGVTSAFEGQVDRYADRVYILTCNGALSEAELGQIRL